MVISSVRRGLTIVFVAILDDPLVIAVKPSAEQQKHSSIQGRHPLLGERFYFRPCLRPWERDQHGFQAPLRTWHIPSEHACEASAWQGDCLINERRPLFGGRLGGFLVAMVAVGSQADCEGVLLGFDFCLGVVRHDLADGGTSVNQRVFGFLLRGRRANKYQSGQAGRAKANVKYHRLSTIGRRLALGKPTPLCRRPDGSEITECFG